MSKYEWEVGEPVVVQDCCGIKTRIYQGVVKKISRVYMIVDCGRTFEFNKRSRTLRGDGPGAIYLFTPEEWEFEKLYSRLSLVLSFHSLNGPLKACTLEQLQRLEELLNELGIETKK